MTQDTLCTKIVDILENMADTINNIATVATENTNNDSSGVKLTDVTDVAVIANDKKVEIKWTDPEDETYNGATLARWAGTKLVRKEGSAPTNEKDGVTVIDSTTRNAYATTAYEDTGLTNGTTYFYRFFPHSAAGTYTQGTSVSAIPNEQKATISVSENAVTLDPSHLQKIVTIASNSDGELSAVCSDATDAICTMSLSGNTITIDAVFNGNTTITINQTDGVKYTAPDPITIDVSVALISSILDENEPSVIQEVIAAGKAASLWSVGDKVGIVLNGIVGTETFSNQKFYASILGFDHNKSIETDDKNSIHFIFGKNEAGTDIAFCGFSGGAWSYNKNSAFRMNLSDTTIGGWKESYMRNTTCPQFFAAMPSEWQSLIGTVTKYTDNMGGSTTGADQVTATQDKIFLLSEFEVQGANGYANEFEKNSQQQYTYYANGNSTIRKNYKEDNRNVMWWTRSVCENSVKNFCDTNTNGYENNYSASDSLGFVPGFALIG